MLLVNVQFVYCMTTSDSILKFSEGSLEEISETTPLSLMSDERATSEQRRAELHETEFRKIPSGAKPTSTNIYCTERC